MIYCSKKFLSDHPEETGSMVCKAVSSRIEDTYSEDPWMEASMQWRDCYGKPVSLDFNVSSDRSLERRIEKIDLIIAELEAFRTNLQVVWEDQKAVSAQWLAQQPKDEEEKPKRPRRSRRRGVSAVSMSIDELLGDSSDAQV